MSIILDHRSAPRRVDDDCIDSTLSLGFDPGVDQPARPCLAVCLVAEMMGKRAAASGLCRNHHLDAEPGEQPHTCRVDRGVEHALCAAGKKDNPSPPLPCRALDTGLSRWLACGKPVGSEIEQRLDPREGLEDPAH